jgi:hypothetical protein
MAVVGSGCGGKAEPLTPPVDTATTIPLQPRAFDLRFKGVGELADSLDLAHTNIFVGSQSVLRLRQDGVAGTPLQLGGANVCSASECDWFFDSFALPPGLVRVGVTYSGNILANLAMVLDATVVSDTVTTSLDIRPATGVFGFSHTSRRVDQEVECGGNRRGRTLGHLELRQQACRRSRHERRSTNAEIVG